MNICFTCYMELFDNEECLKAADDFSGIKYDKIMNEFDMELTNGSFGRV